MWLPNRLELDIQDEDYCDPIYSPTFTRYELDYDAQCGDQEQLEDDDGAAPQEQEHETENESGNPGAVNDPMEYMSQHVTATDPAGVGVTGDDSTAALSYFNVFPSLPRSRTTSAISATSSATDLDEDATGLVRPGAVELECTIASTAVDVAPKASEDSDDRDESGDSHTPKVVARRRPTARAVAARKRQVSRAPVNGTKKRKVAKPASESQETVRVSVRTRSGRQAGSRRVTKAR